MSDGRTAEAKGNQGVAEPASEAISEPVRKKRVPTAAFLAHSWKPGQPGNPKGPAKRTRDISIEAQKKTIEAIDGLARIARDPKCPFEVRRRAYNDIIMWGHGKPRAGKSTAASIAVPDNVLSDATRFLDEIAEANREAAFLNGGMVIENESRGDSGRAGGGQDALDGSGGRLEPAAPPTLVRGPQEDARHAFGVGVLIGQALGEERADDDGDDDDDDDEPLDDHRLIDQTCAADDVKPAPPAWDDDDADPFTAGIE